MKNAQIYAIIAKTLSEEMSKAYALDAWRALAKARKALTDAFEAADPKFNADLFAESIDN